MKKPCKTALTLLLLSFLIVACGTGNADGELVCEPGKTSECMCGPNSPGIQVCKDNGSGWGECDQCCTPDCAGKECGLDGCGGSCGSCSGECDQETGICGEACKEGEKKCVGQNVWVCSPEGSWNSSTNCTGLEVCIDGECVEDCNPDCTGMECGDDGCKGSCGECLVGQICTEEGKCIDDGPCVSNCTGMECGDDGCSGSCGVCQSDEECVNGTCKATAPVCDCGDGKCETACPSETTCNCPEDCGIECPDGCCHELENFESCPDDCKGCGDGTCQGNEDCTKCPADCACDGGQKCSNGECIPCVAWCQMAGYECGSKGGCDCGVCGQDEKCEADECHDDCDALCLDEVCDLLPGTDCDCGDCTGCKDTCSNNQCEATPNFQKGCDGDDVHDYDSCGESGQFVETCDHKCSGGVCLEPGCDVVCEGKCEGFQECICPNCPWGEECNEATNTCEPDCDVLCQPPKECGQVDGTECDCGGCDDGLACTTDTCPDATCHHDLQNNYCKIAGDCVGSGFENPQEPCLKCKPAISPDSWTELEDGAPCGSGKKCYQGTCCDYQANCVGKECGPDGCDGNCGSCDGPQDDCVDDQCVCQSACEGKECGDDGCGGDCTPGCEDGWVCDGGQCIDICTETCESKGWECGEICGELCGSCYGQDQCSIDGQCVCQPACDGMECGPDGCEGICGECLGEQNVCIDGLCVCQPACDGKDCGPDGCDGSCGECQGVQDACVAGLCVCQPACEGIECGADGCGGDCGPCEGDQDVCIEGECICIPDCTGKVCGPNGCDGDCGKCPGDQDVCVDGACVCIPDCDGKVCGSDGCTGNCGDCPGPQDVCTEGQCVCQPACEGKECGDDGCDGACGECPGEQDVCTDWECTCVPACDGKECGADGCGSSCGECPGDQDGCVVGQCVCQPACDGMECGADGCDGLCGSCGGPEVCVEGDCVVSECVEGPCPFGLQSFDGCHCPVLPTAISDCLKPCYGTPTCSPWLNCEYLGLYDQEYYGQDGNFPTGPLSFSDQGDGTAQDNLTGLEWATEPSPAAMDWNSASSWCESNGGILPGDGWRLPTIEELHGIVDYSKVCPSWSPVFGTDCEHPLWFWSSTKESPTTAFWVDFSSTSEVVRYSSLTQESIRVRCVRGADPSAPEGRFIDLGDDVALDRLTGLEWETEYHEGQPWDDALATCINKGGGWRLPNVKELASLLDYSAQCPMHDSILGTWCPFPPPYSPPLFFFWSSTPVKWAGDTLCAWGINFGDGAVEWGCLSVSTYRFRCVRSAP